MEQPNCLRTGGDAKLIPQGIDTNTVLAAYQLLFMLCGITPHQQPMDGLTAWVSRQRQLGELLRGSRFPEIEVDLSQAFECLQILLVQMSLFYQVPVAGRVILEERATVQLYRLLIIAN